MNGRIDGIALSQALRINCRATARPKTGILFAIDAGIDVMRHTAACDAFGPLPLDPRDRLDDRDP